MNGLSDSPSKAERRRRGSPSTASLELDLGIGGIGRHGGGERHNRGKSSSSMI